MDNRKNSNDLFTFQELQILLLYLSEVRNLSRDKISKIFPEIQGNFLSIQSKRPHSCFIFAVFNSDGKFDTITDRVRDKSFASSWKLFRRPISSILCQKKSYRSNRHENVKGFWSHKNIFIVLSFCKALPNWDSSLGF